MEPPSIIVVDDEPLARQRLVRLIAADPEVKLAGECADGVEAIDAVRSLKPDILFLDVEMPEVDGFGVVEALSREELPLVIFVTAYDQHAVRAFEVHALDYLLKPFDDERFYSSLRRARAVLARGGKGEDAARLIRMLEAFRSEKSGIKRIMVRSNGHVTFVRTSDIDWMEAQGDYVSLHSQGKRHLVRENIGDLEAQVRPQGFARIHRSTIVNISRVKELQPLFHGDYTVVLTDGTRLTMSRSYRERFFQYISSVG
jgi:two-component system LytT family response regulator